MSEKKYDIVGLGEILVEILAKDRDQRFDQPGVLLGPYPSGAPAICIDQASRIGAKTALISRVGADDFGRLNIERLKECGTDTSYIYNTPGYTTGTAFVTYFSNGERQFIYHFAQSATGCLAPEDVSETLIRDTHILHVMGCSLTASASMRNAVMKAVKLAYESNVCISFDPNIRRELLDEEEIRKVFWDILSLQDILLVGLKELEWIYDQPINEVVASLLEQKPNRIIVIKDGSKNVQVYSKEKSFRISTFNVKEVDPTGAGDCFDGTFLACIRQGMDLVEAIRYANAAAAMSVTKRGPMEGNNRKETIEEFISQEPELEIQMII